MSNDDLRKSIDSQKEEMEKHRWIESEKANRDLGNNAYIDWIKKHAKSWRDEYERRKKSHQ